MTAKRSIIPVFIPHSGCPNDCVFCNQRKISGSLAAPDNRELREIIETSLSRIPEKSDIQLAFYGGSFTAIPPEEQERLLEGALPFLSEGSISSLRVSTRPDSIDEQTLKRLKNGGVSSIELGAQSMDEQVLLLSGRGHSARHTRDAARLIKEAGFELILQMMTGLPGDTEEKSRETAREIIALSPDGVRIYPTVVIRDTMLFEMWKAGTYPEHTVEQAAQWCAGLLPMFEAASIPVIRLGLNPSDDLSAGEAVAGAYHPAFGEIVRSRILLERAEAALACVSGAASVVLGVHSSDVSAMIGQKRENIAALREKFGLSALKVIPADVKKGEVIIV